MKQRNGGFDCLSFPPKQSEEKPRKKGLDPFLLKGEEERSRKRECGLSNRTNKSDEIQDKVIAFIVYQSMKKVYLRNPLKFYFLFLCSAHPSLIGLSSWLSSSPSASSSTSWSLLRSSWSEMMAIPLSSAAADGGEGSEASSVAAEGGLGGLVALFPLLLLFLRWRRRSRSSRVSEGTSAGTLAETVNIW